MTACPIQQAQNSGKLEGKAYWRKDIQILNISVKPLVSVYKAYSSAVPFIRTESITYPQSPYRYRESSKRDVSEEEKPTLNDSSISGNWFIIQEKEQWERFGDFCLLT